MKLTLWNMIIALRADIGTILERTLFVSGTTQLGQLGQLSSAPLVDEETLIRLRGELRTKLDTLKDSLNRELTENEGYLVMFPLVLLCDEMVMSRLPKQQQTLWFLLQSELFQINYGGDVMYEFMDERLAKPDTPVIVFEVLYYCLSAGFVGKFDSDGNKVQRYKALLSEHIPGALIRSRKRRRRRDGQPLAEPAPSPAASTAEPPAPSRSALWYYAATFGVLLLAVGGVLAVSNL